MKVVLLSLLLPLLACAGQPEATPPATEPVLVSAELARPGLLAQLAGRDDVRRALTSRTEPIGRFQCGVGVLGREGRKVYVWLRCADYRTGPHAELLRGSALPAVVVVDGHDDVVRVRFPRRQTLRADIERMFPARLQDRVIAGDVRTRPGPAALLARAEDTAPRPPGPRS